MPGCHSEAEVAVGVSIYKGTYRRELAAKYCGTHGVVFATQIAQSGLTASIEVIKE